MYNPYQNKQNFRNCNLDHPKYGCDGKVVNLHEMNVFVHSLIMALSLWKCYGIKVHDPSLNFAAPEVLFSWEFRQYFLVLTFFLRVVSSKLVHFQTK